MSKIIWIFMFFFSLKNTNLGAHFLLMTFLITSIFLITFAARHYSNYHIFVIAIDYSWFLAKKPFQFCIPALCPQVPLALYGIVATATVPPLSPRQQNVNYFPQSECNRWHHHTCLLITFRAGILSPPPEGNSTTIKYTHVVNWLKLIGI